MNNVFKLLALGGELRERMCQDGFRQTGRWFAQVLVSLLYSHTEYIVYALSLLEPLPVIESRLPVTLRLATEADLVRFQGLVPLWERRHFSDRLAHGRYCFLALDGENLASYCWATTRVEFGVDNLEMQLQPGDIYGDDAYTVPAYRRQKIQMAVHLYRLRYMRDMMGCQRAVLIVADDNIASQRLVCKLGYEEVDHLSFRRILWKRIYRYHQGQF